MEMWVECKAPGTRHRASATRGGDAQPNSLEMARTVLFNLHGEEKTPDEIRALIRTPYGIDPAKTLDQMLYKWVGEGKTFYKTADGRFGLLEFRSTTDVMRVRLGRIRRMRLLAGACHRRLGMSVAIIGTSNGLKFCRYVSEGSPRRLACPRLPVYAAIVFIYGCYFCWQRNSPSDQLSRC